MLSLPLVCHTSTPSTAVKAVQVTVSAAADGGLALQFAVDAIANRLVLPRPGPTEFTDDLWRHTCFEMFAAASVGAYREFNFSPAGAYAIYDFTGYRQDMSSVRPAQPPVISMSHASMSFQVGVAQELLAVQQAAVQCIGIAAVIEERGGILSYWALRHPGEKPDFHHRDGFVVNWPLRSGVEEHRA